LHWRDEFATETTVHPVHLSQEIVSIHGYRVRK
jgi:hypothetical protein